METVIEIKQLTKDFKTDFWKKKIRAVEDVSFDVLPASTLGLIGPNGSGKTTTIKMLLGLIQPTSGHVNIFGQNPKLTSVRAKIGYLPEQTYYYDYLTPHEILNFYGKLFSIPSKIRKQRIEELLTLVGLAGRVDRKLRHFSKGMLQRLGIAQALINDPDLIILDEPMSGLDPIGRKDVKDIVVKLQQRRKTILFSSHILPDVETLCDHVVVLIKGQLVAKGSMRELVNPKIMETEMVLSGDGSKFKVFDEFNPRCVGNELIFSITNKSDIAKLMNLAQTNGFNVVSLSSHKESLEDLFVRQWVQS